MFVCVWAGLYNGQKALPFKDKALIGSQLFLCYVAA